MRSILVISKDPKIADEIHACFPKEYKIGHTYSIQAALDVLRKKRHDIVLIEIVLLKEAAHGDGYKVALQSFWHLYPSIDIIVISSQDMIRDAVMAVKAGADDYLLYPLDSEEVRHVVNSIHESLIIQSELDYLRDQFWETDTIELVHTLSPMMIGVYKNLRSVAPTKSTVLLSGETGTGKGVMANLIHRHSNRRDGPFISVHCGAIPDTLLESELFGHEKGAFTGAVRRKLGKFEIATGGTIFLDEIGTITPSAQVKLLQVLQDATFQRVGGEETIKADVRVICATNMDLKRMSHEGEFRKDLYYRINVFPIDIPPLRERIEDISHLAEMFLKNMNKYNTKEIHDIAPLVMEAFKRYPWPGNVRELENLIERAYILETSSMLTPESFPAELFGADLALASLPVDSRLTLAEVRRKGIEDIERNYLKELLSQKRGKVKESAESAGITTRQLHKLMVKYGIKKEEFKLPHNHPDKPES